MRLSEYGGVEGRRVGAPPKTSPPPMDIRWVPGVLVSPKLEWGDSLCFERDAEGWGKPLAELAAADDTGWVLVSL
jgi:hypothetical protein